jgi:hypothetical protein
MLAPQISDFSARDQNSLHVVSEQILVDRRVNQIMSAGVRSKNGVDSRLALRKRSAQS